MDNRVDGDSFTDLFSTDARDDRRNAEVHYSLHAIVCLKTLFGTSDALSPKQVESRQHYRSLCRQLPLLLRQSGVKKTMLALLDEKTALSLHDTLSSRQILLCHVLFLIDLRIVGVMGYGVSPWSTEIDTQHIIDSVNTTINRIQSLDFPVYAIVSDEIRRAANALAAYVDLYAGDSGEPDND